MHPQYNEGYHIFAIVKLSTTTAIAWLAGESRSPATDDPPKIPARIFAAFVALLIRYTPRVVLRPYEERKTLEVDAPSADVDRPSKTMTILETKSRGIAQPLLHAAYMLKQQKINRRPAWYSLFKALSRSGAIIVRNYAGTLRNDALSWRVLMAALNDFHALGLELDPQGFIIICHGFCKALPALKSDHGQPREVDEAMSVLRKEFTRLSKEVVFANYLPGHSYTLRAPHLHMYVRAMGAAGDLDGIIRQLKWMVQSNNKLDSDLRIVLVAMRHFLGQREDAQELLERGSALWGGWPDDDEVVAYVRKSNKL